MATANESSMSSAAISIVPDNAVLRFPPFPRAPHGSRVSNFSGFQSQGIILAAHGPPVQSIERRHHELVDIHVSHMRDKGQTSHAGAMGRLKDASINRDGLVSLRIEHAWNIGHLSGSWEEPQGTSIASYDT